MRRGLARAKYLQFAALLDIPQIALQRSDSRSIAEGVQRSVSPTERVSAPANRGTGRGAVRGGGAARGGRGGARGANNASSNGPHAARKGYKPGGYSLAAGVKGARNISEAPVMHVSNIDHHERVSSYDSVESTTSNTSPPENIIMYEDIGTAIDVSIRTPGDSVDGVRQSGICTPPAPPSSASPLHFAGPPSSASPLHFAGPPSSASPLHFAGPISTKPIPASNPYPKATSQPLHHIDSSSRHNPSYNSNEVASMLRQSYTTRTQSTLSDNMDFTKEFNESKVISLDRLKGSQNISDPDGMVPVSAPVSVAPTSSAPRDVTPDIRDVTPDRSRDVTPTRAEKPRDDTLASESPKPEEEPRYCKARYTFKAEGHRELGFKKKDVIRIRREIDANWIEGELDGTVGIFPRNYVDILDPEEKLTLDQKPEELETTFEAKPSYPNHDRAYIPTYQRDVQSLPRGRNKREEDADREKKRKEDENRRIEEEKRRIREKREEDERRAEEDRRTERDQVKFEEEEKKRMDREKRVLDEQKRAQEQIHIEEEKSRLQEEQRWAEEQRQVKEKKKRAEEQRHIKEEKIRAEERRLEDEEKKRVEEQHLNEEKERENELKRAAEQRRVEEQLRTAEKRREELQESLKRAEEQKRVEKQKRAEEKIQVEEQRRREEEERKIKEERLQLELKQREEKRRREEERLQELERVHAEEMEESQRRKNEELRARNEEEQRVKLQNNINYRVSNTDNVQVVEVAADTFTVKAIYSFKTSDSGELSFKKGNEITVTEVIDDNWYFGNIGARGGIFPSSYVTKTEPAEPQQLNQLIEDCQDTPVNLSPDNLSRDSFHDNPESLDNSQYQTNPTYPDNNRQAEESDDSNFQEFELYEAQYTYKPLNSDELELQRGDFIEVIERCEDGWFVGTSQRTEEFGTFPGNYVLPAAS